MSDAHLTVDTSGLDFTAVRNLPISTALRAGVAPIMETADELVPKRTHDLEGSRFVDSTRGGEDAIGYGFDSVYAAYIHENVEFKHPFGGTSKYLELAQVQRSDDALKAAAGVLLDGQQ